jgi:hypothetical protein
MQISLSKFETFGDVAAEDDAVLDYFLSTNAVQRIEKGDAFLVLGRKGTGKTALVRYLTEGRPNPLSKALTFEDIPGTSTQVALIMARPISRLTCHHGDI